MFLRFHAADEGREPVTEVETYFRSATTWRAEAEALRAILLDCGLGEALKWGKPTYIHAGGNIAQIQKMKTVVTLLFFKGALLDDDGTLEFPGENSRIGKRMRFKSLQDVTAQEASIRNHVVRAMKLEEEGTEVEPDRSLDLPEELAALLAEDPDVSAAFDALTPGRQRSWALHVGGAKKTETRQSRARSAAPRILDGKGFMDR